MSLLKLVAIIGDNSAISTAPEPPPSASRIPLTLEGKKLVGFGDSIMAGANANTLDQGWIFQVLRAANGQYVSRANGGKGFLPESVGGSDNYLKFSEVPVYDSTHKYIFFNLSTNDTSQTTSTWWNFRKRLYEFVDHCTQIKGWPAGAIVLATPYFGYYPVFMDSPWYIQDYINAITEVANVKGTILADIHTPMTAKQQEVQLLTDGAHPNQIGHDFIANFYINELDCTPKVATPLVITDIGPQSGTDEAEAWATATGDTINQAAIAAFVKKLKERRLWDKLIDFVILGSSFAKSKYSVKDAQACIYEVNTGTWVPDGWTGGTYVSLRFDTALESLNHQFTQFVRITGNNLDSGLDNGMQYDMGNDKAYLVSKSQNDSRIFLFALGAQSYPATNRDGQAAGRYFYAQNTNHFIGAKNGMPTNFYMPNSTATGLGYATIGNGRGSINGSTRKIRMAGLFSYLTHYEMFQIDALIAELETSLIASATQNG